MNKIVYLDKSKKPETFAEFNSDKIRDICFVKDRGFFFISNHCIGMVDLFGNTTYPFLGKPGVSKTGRGFRDNLTFDNPSSLCHRESGKSILVVCGMGNRIVSLNLMDDYYCLPAFSNDIEHRLDPLFNINTKDGKTSVVTDGMDIAWIVSSIHRAFVVSTSGLRIIGNGKAGYSISSKEEYSSMNKPEGIAMNGRTVTISDTANHCIRTFNENNHSLVDGHPIDSGTMPGKIVRLKDSLYMMDGNEVKVMFSSKTKPVSLYKGNVVSIAIGTQNRLAVVVED